MHLCIYVSSYMCIPKFRKDACTRMQIWNKPHAHHHVHARRSLCRCLQEQTTCMCMQRLDTSMLVDSYIPFWHTQRHVHNSCVCTQDMVMLLKRYSLFWVGKIPQLRAGGALQWKSSWASVSGWCDSDMHAGVAKAFFSPNPRAAISRRNAQNRRQKAVYRRWRLDVLLFEFELCDTLAFLPGVRAGARCIPFSIAR